MAKAMREPTTRLGLLYRVLLRVYPSGRRRAELAETLIEAGRSRPRPGEAAGLVRHGLRARLGRPGRRGVVVMAMLVALITGYGGAAVTDRIAWEFVPGFPAGAERAEIGASLYPDRPARAYVDGDGLYHDFGSVPSWSSVLLWGHSDGFEFADLTYTTADSFLPGDDRAWAERARGRLAAAGWRVGEIESVGSGYGTLAGRDGTAFTARRGGLDMRVTTSLTVSETPAGWFMPEAVASRLTPGWVTGAVALAWLVFGLVGWLVTGWACRRTARAHYRVQMLTYVPPMLAMFLLVPQVLLVAMWSVLQGIDGGAPTGPFWSISVVYGHFFVQAGVLLLLVAVGAAASARPEPGAVEEPSWV